MNNKKRILRKKRLKYIFSHFFIATIMTIVPPTIKHLVVAGGAHMGFSYFGALKTLCQRNFFQLANIESIYATSVGTIVAVFLSLQTDWKDLDEYIINIPWKRLFPTNIRTAFMAVPKGGLFDVSSIERLLEPILLDHDLSLNTTLQEFYEYNQKEMHFITTLYEPLKTVDLSYKTHPKWRLVDAVYASSCLPVLFVPHCCSTTGELYIDGAMYANYPIDQCLSHGCTPEEILGVYFDHQQEDRHQTYHKSSLRLIFYLLDLFGKLLRITKHSPHPLVSKTPYQIEVIGDSRIHEALSVISSKHKRREFISKGEQVANDFLQSIDYDQTI